MTILVGTASWSGRTPAGGQRFYPPGVDSAEARLRYYASRFALVEVDASYYAIPTPLTTQRWAERTPSGFAMNLKAFRLFTGHPASPTVLPRDIHQALPPSRKTRLFLRDVPAELVDELWRRFTEALLPLRAAGRLGLVHFQFPPWVLRNAEGHRRVRDCVARMAGYPVSVEYRHESWFVDACATAATLAFEREFGVVHTVVDEPQGFSNSVPAVWAATHPNFALVRLHGRNRAAWNVKDAGDSAGRFDYDYRDDELAAIAAPIRRLSAEVASTHVVFNNLMEGPGQRNAGSLAALLNVAAMR